MAEAMGFTRPHFQRERQCTMQATATTTTAKGSRKAKAERAQVDEATEPVGGAVSNDSVKDSEAFAKDVTVQLERFGILIPIDEFDGLNQDELNDLKTSMDLVIRENWGSQVDGIEEDRRTKLPEWVMRFEAVSAPLARDAANKGEDAKQSGRSRLTCPYPPGTAVAKIWQDAYDEAKVAPKSEAKTPTDDFAQRQRAAIADARSRMEQAVSQQREYRGILESLKRKTKSVKQHYEDAVEAAESASEELEDAIEGRLPAQRVLPFKDDETDTEEAAPVAKPKRDEGGFIDLEYLIKGRLQEYIPGTPEDKGLSEKQVEKLKKAVGGDTIADLEKFQQSKGTWWTKEIEGFGPEAITKLQDVHEIMRRKFPIPDPSDTTDEDEIEDLTTGQAIERLSKLIERCGDVGDECDHEDGKSFCESVAKSASEMRAKILNSDQVTGAQIRALFNWESGVSKWEPDELDDDFDDE